MKKPSTSQSGGSRMDEAPATGSLESKSEAKSESSQNVTSSTTTTTAATRESSSSAPAAATTTTTATITATTTTTTTTTTIAAATAAATTTTTIADAHLPQLDTRFDIYAMMKKMLPDGAVRQKMSLEGFSQEEIDRFFSGAPMHVTEEEEEEEGGGGGGGGGGGIRTPASSKSPLIIECPHCSTTIMVESLNCRYDRSTCCQCRYMYVQYRVYVHICTNLCNVRFVLDSIHIYIYL